MNSTQGNNQSNSTYGRSNKHAALEEWMKRKHFRSICSSYMEDAYDQLTIDSCKSRMASYENFLGNPVSPIISNSKEVKHGITNEGDQWKEANSKIHLNLLDTDFESRNLDVGNADSFLVQLENSISDKSLRNFTMSDDGVSSNDSKSVSASCWDSDSDDFDVEDSKSTFASNECANITQPDADGCECYRETIPVPENNAKVGPDSQQMQVIYRMLEYLETNKLELYLTRWFLDLEVKHFFVFIWNQNPSNYAPH